MYITALAEQPRNNPPVDRWGRGGQNPYWVVNNPTSTAAPADPPEEVEAVGPGGVSAQANGRAHGSWRRRSNFPGRLYPPHLHHPQLALILAASEDGDNYLPLLYYPITHDLES